MTQAWNPADKHADIALSGGDLIATATATSWKSVRALDGEPAGKWYFEVLISGASNNHMVGVGNASAPLSSYFASTADGFAFRSDGQKWTNAAQSSYGSAYTNGDVVGVAVDMDNGAIWFAINGTWQAGASASEIEAGNTTNAAYTGLSGEFFPMYSPFDTGIGCTARFASVDWTQSAPTGFIAFGELAGVATMALEQFVVEALGQAILALDQSVDPLGEGLATQVLRQNVALAVGVPAQQFAQTVEGIISRAVVRLRQRGAELGRGILSLSQTVAQLSGRATLTLEQRGAVTGIAAVGLSQRVYDAAVLAASTERWRVAVNVAGDDVSERLTGEVRIEAEESAARIAEFTMVPDAGPITPSDWIGRDVGIDYLQVDAAGAVLQRWRRFTGVVDLAEYDPVAGALSARCTDQLQESFERTPVDVLAAFVPGQWSGAISGDPDDGWHYVQERIRAAPYAVEFDSSRSLRITSWQAKASADLTLGAARILDGSLALELAPRRALHNTVQLSVEYRYERLYQRDALVGWHYPRTFCAYLEDSTELPNKQMVSAALNGTGWLLNTLTWDPVPATGVINCGNRVHNWISSPEDGLILGYSARLVRRWTQTVTERYRLSVRAPAAAARHGTLLREDRASASAGFDWQAYEGFDAENRASSGLATGGGNASGIPGASVGGTNPVGPPAGATLDEFGDYVLDQANRATLNELLATAVARAAVDLIAAHRAHRVVCSTPLRPDLELYHTLRIETSRVTAQGKIAHIIEDCDIDTGEATTTVRIAVMRGGDSQLGWDEAQIPAPASQASVPAPGAAGLGNTSRETFIGGRVDAPEFEEQWSGFSGNWTSTEPGAHLYPRRYRLDLPAIEPDRREARTAELERAITVRIPDDELSITA